MTDKHCGKNDINGLYMWNYEVGLNWIYEKLYKNFPVKIQREETYKIARVSDKHCGKNDIKELHV